MGVFPTTPPLTEILETVLSFQKRESKTTNGVRTNNFVTVELFEVNDEGILETFAGLEELVTRHLRGFGYNVTVERLALKKLDVHLDRLELADMAAMADRTGQIDVLGMIVDEPAGFIVKAPTGWGKSHIITQVCKALPKNKIAIVAPGVDIVGSIHRRLCSQMNRRDIGIVGDGNRDVRRITVCTTNSIHRLAKADWDLLMFDEVHTAGAPETANNIAEVFHDCKTVGFSASPAGRSDGSDLVVQALFGPVKYEVTYAEAEADGAISPIHVQMHRIEVGPDIARYSNPTTKNKYGLWFNRIRNEYIAKLANAIDDDDQTLIIVSTAQHALQLKLLLPEYQVVFSSTKQKTLANFPVKSVPGLSFKGVFDAKYRRYLTDQFERGNLKKAIATGVWNTGVDFVHLKYLIRCEGLASAIQATQTPGRLSRIAPGKTHGTLIDFMDSFDSTMENRSINRLREYRKKGWRIEEVIDPDVQRLV